MSFEDYRNGFNLLLPLLLVAAGGWLLRRTNRLSEETAGGLLRLTEQILLPALILQCVLQNGAVRDARNVVLAPFFGFFGIAGGLGAAWLLARYAGKFLGLTGDTSRSAFVLCAGIGSFQFAPLWLAKTFFGTDTVGVLLVHNLGAEIAVWTLGLTVLGVTGVWRGWKKLFTAPLLTLAVALLLNLTKLDQRLPHFVMWTINLLGEAAVPLGVLLLGAAFASSSGAVQPLAGWRTILAACALRLGLLPWLFLLPANWLPLPVELRQVLVFQAVLPAAAFSLLMVRHYGADDVTARRVVWGTTILGIFTAPIWLWWGMRIANVPWRL